MLQSATHCLKEAAELSMRGILRTTRHARIAQLQRDRLDELKDRGICVVDGFIGPAEAAQVRTEIDRLLASQAEGPARRWTDDAGSDHRIFHAERESELLARFVADPELELYRSLHSGY